MVANDANVAASKQTLKFAVEARATWLACAQHIQNGNDSMQKGAARPLAYLLGCDLDAWQKHGKAAAQRLAQAGDAGAAIAAAAEGVAVDPEAQTSFDRMFSGMRETNALGITLWAKANLKLAKAQSRKYLLWLIIAGIAIYFILKSGGGGSAIFDKIKGFMP